MNYFIVCENYKNTGVEKKIDGQKKALKQIGNFKFIGFSEKKIINRLLIFPFKIYFKLKNVDKIYYRYSSLNFFIHLILILFFKENYYLEINTKNRDELKISQKRSFKNKIKYLFNKIWEKVLYKKSYKIITFTEEIKSYINEIYRNKKTKVIENGYYTDNNIVNQDKEKKIVPEKAYKYKFVAIIASTFYTWAGIDLILDVIKNQGEIFLIIVGFGPEKENIKNKIKKEKIINTEMVGRKTSSELKILYENSDFGFGSFALERKGMKMAKPLKVREYLINGLPVVYNYEESNAISKMDYCLKYDGDIKKMKKFISKVQNFDRDKIRKKGLKLFNWENILKEVL